MRKTLILATLATLVAATIPAAADDQERGQSAQANPVSADEMKARIDKLGYDVRRLKSDDGYFKTIIVDRNSGGAVRATFNAATGELVRARLASRG
jgi:Peptidase propeptide and YPEB domain